MALALSLAVAGPSLADAPPCRVSLALEPREAFVDQQVLHRLRIEARPEVRHIEWLVPPAFAGLRSERLAGSVEAGRVTHAGVEYRVREERTALFPERSGSFELSEASLRCSAAFEVLDVWIPPARLLVRPLPEAGRPADFAGLVGRVELIRQVEPRAGTVGRSLRVTVRLRGEGNLWDAADPYASDAFAGAEVFPLGAEQDLERGDRLRVGRLFRYDLVPVETGPLELPALRVPWFDPERRIYAVASEPALRVRVAPAPASVAEWRSGSSESAPPAAPRGAAPVVPRLLWIAGVATLLAAGAALFVARRRGAARLPEGAEDDPAAWGRALRAALARHVPDAAQRTPEELLAGGSLPPAAREAATLLAALERARFDPETGAPERREVERVIAALQRARR